jgi:hypothetical protein
MAVLLLAFALAASLPQAPPPADTAMTQSAPVARAATGAIIIPYPIDSDPPAEINLDRLVGGEAGDRGEPDSLGRRSPARQANDEALEEAFEEALDQARFGQPN